MFEPGPFGRGGLGSFVVTPQASCGLVGGHGRTLGGMSRGQLIALLIVVALIVAAVVVAAEWWRVAPGLIALIVAAIAVMALVLIALDRSDKQH